MESFTSDDMIYQMITRFDNNGKIRRTDIVHP